MRPRKPNKDAVAPDFSGVINQNKYRSFTKILHDFRNEALISQLKIQFVVAIDYSNSNEFSGYESLHQCLHGPSSPYLRCLQDLKQYVESLPISNFLAMRFGDSETTNQRVLPLHGT